MPVHAHWIPPIKSTRTPSRHIILDCEAHRSPEAHGERQTWRLAVTAAVQRPDRSRAWSETRWGRHRTPEDLWRWVADVCDGGGRTVLVAHNLGYDLRIAQAFHWLPRLGFDLQHLRTDHGAASASWAGPRGQLLMTDSLAWLPVSLAAIGDLLGIKKPDLPEEADGDEAWWTRCEADVRILREAWLHLVDWVDLDDLGAWRASGAGQAWNHWRHRHYTHRVLALHVPAVRDAERESIYAGRCEAWRWGNPGRGPWDDWDHSLAYARVCAEIDLPVRYRLTRRAGTRRAWIRDRERYEVLALVDIETDVPVVPTLHEGRRVWPVGRFRSWLWAAEVDLLEQAGGTAVPVMWHCYDGAPALRSWALWAIDVVEGPGAHERPLERLAVKHWTRALPGRFGARYADWERYGDAKHGDGALTVHLDPESGRRYRVLDLAGGAIAEGEPLDVPDSAPAVLSRITAECRIRLWRAMTTAGLDSIAYVDTDGLIVDREGSARLRDAGLPGLRRKARYKVLRVYGPRQFVADEKLKAAGIPKGAVYLGGGRWGGDVWESLPAALATGRPGEVRIRERVWNLAGTDERRIHLPGGETDPLRLDVRDGAV